MQRGVEQHGWKRTMEFVAQSFKRDMPQCALGTLCTFDCHFRFENRIGTCLGGLFLVSPSAYVSSAPQGERQR